MGSGYFNVKLPALKMSHYTEMKTKILPGYLFVQTSNIKACGVYVVNQNELQVKTTLTYSQLLLSSNPNKS